MITVMRERLIQSRWVKVLAWISVIALAGVFSIPKLSDTRQGWVARVNGDTISQAAFVRKTFAEEALLQEYREKFGKYLESFLQMYGKSYNPKESALHSLLQQTLLNQAAHALGLHVSADRASGELQNIAFVQQELSDVIPLSVFDRSGSINQRLLADVLRRMQISPDQFAQLVQEGADRELLVDLLINQVYIPDFALREQYIKLYSGKSFSVLAWPLDTIVEQLRKNPMNATELKQFFDQQNARLQQYRVPEKRHGMLWKFTPATYGVVISDAAIQDYYEQTKTKKFVASPAQMQVRRILLSVPAGQEQLIREQAQKLKQELAENPSSFAHKAQELSQDKKSAASGGLMPFVQKGSQDAAFDKAVFTLSKDGMISDPIRTKDGIEIIQRVAYKHPTYLSLAQVKEDIKKELIKGVFEKQINDDLKPIINQRNDDQALEALVAAKKIKAETISSTHKEAQSTAAKNLFELAEKSNEVTFWIDKDGTAFILKLQKVEPSYVPALDDIKDTVTKDYYFQKALMQVEEELKKATELLNQEPIAQVAKKVGASIEQIPMVLKKDAARLSDLRKQGLPIDKMLKLEKVGSIMIHGDQHSAYLIIVDAVQAFDEQNYAAKKQELYKTVLQEQQQQLPGAFVASLYRNATITLNESLGKHQ